MVTLHSIRKKTITMRAFDIIAKHYGYTYKDISMFRKVSRGAICMNIKSRCKPKENIKKIIFDLDNDF